MLNSKLSLAVAAYLASLAISPAQAPPERIDLSKFPAAAVQDVVVPVPSEIFAVLDKIGSPNWRAEMRENLGTNTGNRAQVALLLGTVIADGFIAVEAEDAMKVKEVGRDVLNLSIAINVKDAVISRCKAITDKADAKDWQAVRREFDGALHDVRGAMNELGDEDLAQLVSIGGWVRGTEVLTSIVEKNYTADGAGLLYQPELVSYFSNQIDGMKSSRLKKEPLIAKIRKMLREIRPLIGKQDGTNIPAKNVERIHQMTSEIVVSITSGEN